MLKCELARLCIIPRSPGIICSLDALSVRCSDELESVELSCVGRATQNPKAQIKVTVNLRQENAPMASVPFLPSDGHQVDQHRHGGPLALEEDLNKNDPADIGNAVLDEGNENGMSNKQTEKRAFNLRRRPPGGGSWVRSWAVNMSMVIWETPSQTPSVFADCYIFVVHHGGCGEGCFLPLCSSR